MGLALAGIITAYLATMLGPRSGLLLFGMTTIILAMLLTLLWVKDTLPWAKSEAAKHKAGILWLFGAETHPRINPATDQSTNTRLSGLG